MNSIDTSVYSGVTPLEKALKVDIGTASIQYGKTLTIQVNISDSSYTNYYEYGIISQREGSTGAEDLEYLEPKDATETGYISMDIWFTGTLQEVAIDSTAKAAGSRIENIRRLPNAR